MTVRDATRRESPDGNVFYIEELRRHLGVRTDPGEGSSSNDATTARSEILLIGHNMHDDFQKMDKDGIDLKRYFHYVGCVDTQVVIEDTGAGMGKSLSASMYYYDLADLELKKPQCPKIPPKLAYIGAHCAGNDAVATLEISIAQALDLSLKTSHEDLVYEGSLPEDWFDCPLQGMNKNLILLAYDTEGVETLNYKPRVLNRTSEHGFAWVRVANIAHIQPGEHGKNWRPYYKARHWMNQDFRNFENRYFCIGNPNGFWPEYGQSQYYSVSEGPAPFHRLFEELANVTAGEIKRLDTTEEVTSVLEQTTLGDSTPITAGNETNTRRKQCTLRGNTKTIRGNTTKTKSKQPAFGGNRNIIRGSSINTGDRQSAFESNTNSNWGGQRDEYRQRSYLGTDYYSQGRQGAKIARVLEGSKES